MKVSIPRKDLLEALTVAARVVAKQTALPTCRSVLLEASNGKLQVSATDIETCVALTLDARVETEGKLCVPAVEFRQRIAPLQEADVLLEADGQDGQDLKHDLKFQCRRTTGRLRGLSPEDFPAFPEVPPTVSFAVPQRELKRLIAQSAYAASDDGTRPILTAMLLRSLNGKLTAAATDTHRLGVSHTPLDASEGDALVPAETAKVLEKALADSEDLVRVGWNKNLAQFQTDTLTLTTRLIDGVFPRYGRVIPSSWTKRWTVNRDELIALIRRLKPDATTKEGRPGEQFTVTNAYIRAEGEVLIAEATSDEGSVSDEVEIEREGDEIEFAVDIDYLREALESFQSVSVHLEGTEPLGAWVVRPVDGDDALCTVMSRQPRRG